MKKAGLTYFKEEGENLGDFFYAVVFGFVLVFFVVCFFFFYFDEQ